MTLEHLQKLKETFTEAHNQYSKELSKYAFFKVNDRDLSMDLVQNTFMKTWNYLMQGGKIDTMKAFLYRVLNCLIIDQYRKHKTVSLDVLSEKGFEPNVDDCSRLFEILDGKKVLLLLKKIPSKYQNIIYMRYIKDMSLDEISTDIGVSKNNIAVQIHRGIKELKLLYK